VNTPPLYTYSKNDKIHFKASQHLYLPLPIHNYSL